jgi:hypothetical protein
MDKNLILDVQTYLARLGAGDSQQGIECAITVANQDSIPHGQSQSNAESTDKNSAKGDELAGTAIHEICRD